MDFWTYFNGFWVFPLLCFLFMALMMVFGCHGIRVGCRDESLTPRKKG